MDTMPQLYKLVGPAGECVNGGSGDWPLPTATEPGAWREVDGPLQACVNGLHLTDAAHIRHWARGSVILYRAEVDGEAFDEGEKWVARRVRLLPRRKAATVVDATGFAAAEARRKRALDRIRKAAGRAEAALSKPTATEYLSRIAGGKLPVGHPLADKAKAVTAYQAAVAAIRATANAKAVPIENRYQAAIAPAVDPRYA